MQRDTYFDRVLDTGGTITNPGASFVSKCWEKTYGRYAMIGMAVFVLCFVAFGIFTPELFKTGKKKRRKRVWSRILTGAALLTLILMLLPFGFRHARSKIGY